MNKTELISAVAEQSGLTKKDAEKAVTAVIDTIIDSVAKDEKVQIAGFGTFEQRQRKARTGSDPRTGNRFANIGKRLGQHLDDHIVCPYMRHIGREPEERQDD